MAQVTGRDIVVGIFEETTYASATGVTVGELAYIRSFGLAGTIARILDETLSGFRGLPQSIVGNKDVSGPVVATVAAQSICKWLKHLFGTVTAYRPVGTTTITGVTPVRAGVTATTGNGTLTFLIAGTTLAWTPPSGTIGTAVNISAGGRFTLTAGGGGASLIVDVVAANIPVGNSTDAAVAVYATTEYEQVFTPGALPTGLLLELNNGTKITAANRWLRYLGCRIGGAKFTFKDSGYIDASFDLKGANFNNDSGVALDASLDDYGHSGFSMFSAAILEGGAAIANVTQAVVDYSNELDDSSYVIGGAGVRAELPESFFKVGGSVEALFSSPALLNKAIAGTETALRIAASNGNGRGSAGNEYFALYIPKMFYEAATPAVQGPKGIRTNFNFMGHRPSTGGEIGVEAIVRTTRNPI